MNDVLMRWARNEATDPLDADSARWTVGAADESGLAVEDFDRLVAQGRHWLDAYKVAMFNAMVRLSPSRRLVV